MMRDQVLKLLFFFILFPSIGVSQRELSGFYLESRQKADSVYSKIIERETKSNNPYLLISSNNQFYLVVLDRDSHYTMVHCEFNQNGAIDIQKVINQEKSNTILNRAFDTSGYHTGFISFDSEFFKDGYEIAYGSPTYFVLKNSEGKRFGESVLSVLVKPNPIDPEVYGYLFSALINQKR